MWDIYRHTERNYMTVEKVILVGIDTGDGDIDRSLDELAELAVTAGAEVVGRSTQAREYPHPGTYIGKGKVEELEILIDALSATGIICDDELSPAQMKNLEDMLNIKVMDRTMLILDIFAGRATSNEGKIQVELAQLRYSLTRLAGHGTAMSRLGGGIGTRGPGETKLETDKRRIRSRISNLKEELRDVIRHREVTRSKREKEGLPVVAIVGYTNAGKSTLLNKISGSDVLSEDKLFATLDPTTRNVVLPSGMEILLTDTVGFINKLPHHLIDAFKSTLEEAKYADVIVHVVDSVNPGRDMQTDIVYSTLDSLKISGKPVITLFNKCDREDKGRPDDASLIHRDSRAERVLDISALTGQGIDEFLDALTDILRASKAHIDIVLSYNEGSILQRIRTKGEIIKEEYLSEGVHIEAYVPRELAYLGKEPDKEEY